MILHIEKLIYGGAGLGVHDGKKCFVPFTAPGDVVNVNEKEDHKSFVECEIVSIETPSPCRVKAPCPVFGSCGGCQWQHILYASQLEWKKKILIESFRRIGGLENFEVPDTLPSPREWHYRNKIQLHVDSRGRVGFYRPRSKEVVEFPECMIADEAINLELNSRRDEISKRDRGIALRVENGASFEQINSAQNENLKAKVVEWMKEVPHDTILELYAGAGNFAFALAAIAERVVASDIDGRSIQLAKERQEAEKKWNIEFVCAPARPSFGGGPGARAARRLQTKCDAVLADPPRKGMEDSIDTVCELKPQTLFYISCDPVTLARDAMALANRGFKLIRSQPVDMFPQTYHIESLSMFVKM